MKNWNRSKYLGTWVRVELGIFSVRFSVIFDPDLNLLTPCVDAFTDTAFKGNPAAVCLLDDTEKDDKWLQSVAAEFNISETCYLTPVAGSRFNLRWFTPVAEVTF
ncbi:putative trans-2,3-dihydro-3-hydroxyanthranilate isomerase [Helianthus anomalus]